MLKPTDVIPHLGKGEAHWREGYSAHALATVWFGGLPASVSRLLNRHEQFRGAELIDAILERKTDLRDGVRGESQTDLLAILGVDKHLAIAAVEGKVEEPFGQRVSEWLTAEEPKQRRLAGLVRTLNLGHVDVSGLRYQLLHRTAAAIYEAQRYRAPVALLLVHSFSANRTGWADFALFAQALGMNGSVHPGEIVGPKRLGTVDLYAAWLADVLPTGSGASGS